MPEPFQVFVGWDSREQVASEVAAHSIRKRTHSPVNIQFLKHRELREKGLFRRKWSLDADTGNFRDDNDGKPFSTEFSHTRFLVPSLMNFKGWALFIDADMIFLSDIAKLFALSDDRFAAMCVKHKHDVTHDAVKMDDRPQHSYYRKNWSSFVLWNCSHPANQVLTKEYVNYATGTDLHSFSWLHEALIGSLPITYNYISGVSPKLPPEAGGRPSVVHYTDGGPWFENCRDVPYAQYWLDEYEHFQREREDYVISDVPCMAYDRADV